MSFEPANLFTCDSNYYLHLFYSKYSRRNFSCRSRQHQAIQLWLHLQQIQFTLNFIGGTAHWLNRHRDSLEVIQDFPLNTDQEYYSHCWRNIRALYAKVHLNLSRKVQPLWSRTLVINWQLNWQLANLLAESAPSSKLQLYSLEQKFNFIMTFNLWLINHYLSRHVCSREAYC